MILIDARAPIRERIGALARALSERQTETVFMLPKVREAVETMRELRLGGNTSQSIALDGGCAMPRYEFLCEKCKKPFELIMTMSEREKAKPRCPTCKGTKVTPQLGGFMAQTAKKS
jgi:putative FmdB family regulatory protein